MNTTNTESWFSKYMISGIIEADIFEDGGLECYKQIPFEEHTMFVILLTILHLYFLFRWRKYLSYQSVELQPSTFQKRFAILSLLSYIITAYFKLETRKGMFMFNPCHINILIQVYLLMSKNTQKNRMIYTAWTGWLFGPYMATFIPHLNGIQQFQVLMYYFEHLAIIPCGYMVLSRRYGFMKPNFRNQMPAFTSIALYQFVVLTPLSRMTMVNLNFTLCHSPADPSFQFLGFYYYVICTFVLNFFSYLARWFSYLQVRIVYKMLSLVGIKSVEIKEQIFDQINTPQPPRTA